MSAPTWAALRHAKVEIGDLLSRHERGMSFEELARYEGRFPEFCRDIFGMELTPQQIEGGEALDHNRQVLIVGANGVGKDTLTAARALYELYVLGALVLLSGPSLRQVQEIMMRREVGRLWRRARGKLPGERYEMAIRIPGRERTGLLAFTATNPDLWQGHHADRLFIGITEGSAVPAEIYEASQGCLVGPGALLVVTNPTTPACAPYTFNRSRAWCTLTWSALDHPNVVEGREVVPGAVTKQWVHEKRLEHGESSRFWQVRILAQWPEEAESPLIRAEWWDAAADRAALYRLRGERRDPLNGNWLPGRWIPPVVGIDPAREGEDQTGMAVVQGGVILELARWRAPTTTDNARRVEREVKRLLATYHGVQTVVVDEVALGGGVLDELAERLPRLKYEHVTRYDVHHQSVKVEGFKSSRRAGNSTRFRDRKAECFHYLATQFERGAVALDPDLDGELRTALREELLHHQIQHGADDRIAIASKDELRAALGRSPDLADALMMAFATEVHDGSKRARFR
jgi:hypothetical protein